MTRIDQRKTIIRAETNATRRGRTLIVTLEPHEVQIREKGRRKGYSVPWIAVYDLGAKLYAMEARRIKMENRKKGRS